MSLRNYNYLQDNEYADTIYALIDHAVKQHRNTLAVEHYTNNTRIETDNSTNCAEVHCIINLVDWLVATTRFNIKQATKIDFIKGYFNSRSRNAFSYAIRTHTGNNFPACPSCTAWLTALRIRDLNKS